MTPLRFIFRFLVFVLVFVVVAEGWLRYVMPASEQPALRQDRKTLVMSFDPTVERDGLATLGRMTRRLGWWHVNNEGWLSPYNYTRRSPGGHLIALFGDSYVQGLSVPQTQHLDVDLHHILGPSAPVYAFGESGWYLEQYVALSRYVRATYAPDLIVILIGEGDISESLSHPGAFPYWWYIAKSGSGYREVPPSQVYVLTRRARLARESALFRYLRYNAEVQIPFAHGGDVGGAPTGADAAGPEPTTPQAEQQAVETALPPTRFMVARLCAANPGVPIVFAAMGDRYLPADAVATTPLQPEMEALREVSAGYAQCHFLDLRTAFSLDWAQHHERFEALDGGHYNAHADAVAARAIAAYIETQSLLGGAPRP
jgi:lysophospholipase L1-like esterase